MRELDDPQASDQRPKARRRIRRDEILADAVTPKQTPRMPRGFPGRATWRTLRSARASATAQPPLVIEGEPVPDNDPDPGRARWANLPILALLGLLVILAGVLWFLRAPAVQQRPGALAPPAGFERIDLPGQSDPRGGQMTVATAADRRVLLDFESELLRQGGISEVTYAGSAQDQYKYLLYAYPSAGPETARAATETIRGIHERLGLKDANVGALPGGVPAVELRNSKAAVMRTLYTSGNFTVQISVLQDPAGDANGLRAEFRRAVALVAGVLPPEPQDRAGG